ncbi:PatA/PatG family cyanobactin maturation protease [Endozoicomonas sp. SM1973]|uniref:PatA/PatG family cyanobactin maturation protease n=1 Tax=Spartinivicinus marinus TaxID=2994442 RepID=A0A853I349_9GAMM|nr:PatA/PatG family cyanobactin maturation protease [Spartinivicinus marinus]MCX4029563.1 PatA/PatG family cyanobactin maturation protease [Spartinivicinus marinus]NYZ65138.1 PatA/PatG family cyanobactin maturation protease [Spartinivicinus marinus]
MDVQNKEKNECLASPIHKLQTFGKHGDGIKIAIIDGGIDPLHPELHNVQITSELNKKSQCTTHGTAVCSLICGHNIGIAKSVNILSLPVFYEDTEGQIHGCSERKIANAIRQAVKFGSDVINISGAGLSVNGRGTDELRKAVSLCEKAGIIIIAAVGNEGVNSESLPGSLPYVIAVGACDRNGIPAAFNNYGIKLRKKMLLASGVGLPVAANLNQYNLASGSSFSAPVVSAVSALILNSFHQIPKPQRGYAVKKALFESASLLVQPQKTISPIHRLNLAALAAYVEQFTNHQPKRGKPSMDEKIDIHHNDENEVISDTIDTGQEVLSSDDIDASSKSVLALPKIEDSASNNHVHNPATIVSQSNSDPRTAKHKEKVFLIGTIGYDFGTEARLDYFSQVMGNQGMPFDPVEMATHLNKEGNTEQSNALIWTLKIDGIPVYAIEPDNQFAVLQYARLVEFIHDQETEGVERVSIAGTITGEVRLFNGHVVPTISPVLRGMFNWKSKDLSHLVIGNESKDEPQRKALTNFLHRIYYELRNRGSEPNERAINYAATNAYQMKEIFDDAFSENLFLNKISAEESPVSRPDSDCWDVILEFFNPKERLTAARKLFRYTVDVSDIIPVTIGHLRSWHAY